MAYAIRFLYIRAGLIKTNFNLQQDTVVREVRQIIEWKRAKLTKGLAPNC